MNQVGERVHRDYLVERLEAVLGRGAPEGLYPRLDLGTGRRFASRSGYLGRFSEAQSGRLVPVGERIVP
jgi:hypothetical protein